MKVVFIVPCFNAGPNLRTLIDSILCQNDKRWECILIDDLSEDDRFEQFKRTIDLHLKTLQEDLTQKCSCG